MAWKTTAPGLAIALALLGCGGGGKGPSASAYPVDTTTIAPGHQSANPAGWYRDAVIYQVWVSAFADGLYNDGIGDLPGLQGKLDYLQGLGVNTLWLSPIFECEDKSFTMNGYDTTDYHAVNDRFGRQADLASLIDAVHGRGMRILFDFVPNHTSTSHPWFTGSATQGSYYVWQAHVPPDWGFPWGGGSSDQVWLQADAGYFYSAFGTKTLADLDYYNPEVTAAMQGVEAYWLDRGFDGMRVDAARYLCETGPGAQADTPDTHNRLQGFRAVLDQYAGASTKAMIAEAWTSDATGVGAYYGNGANEFNLCLDFSAPWAIANAIQGGAGAGLTGLWDYEQSHYPAGYRSAVFDSNHDAVISRPGTQYKGQARQIILHEALDLLAPGTPIIYYGNEVGMTGDDVNTQNLRQPMDWGAAATQAAQPDSILSWCKYFIQARTAYPALRGAYTTLATDVGPTKAIAYLMTAGSEQVCVVASLASATQTVTLTDLTAHGVPVSGPVQAIIGDLKGVTALTGTTYPVTGLPPFGIRVLYVSGSSFQSTVHGDPSQ